MFKQRQGCGGYRNPEGVDRSREGRKGRVQIAKGGDKNKYVAISDGS